jgi:hypothetical protein
VSTSVNFFSSFGNLSNVMHTVSPVFP